MPYASGAVTGVQVLNYCGDEGWLFSNDGVTVKLLGTYSGYASTDPLLSNHPPAFSFGAVQDGEITDVGSVYGVNKDLSAWDYDENMSILMDIQDVAVPAGTFHDCVTMWWIDANYPFTPLTFPKEGIALGIDLPSDLDTGGYSLTGFEILAPNVGLIAHGSVDAASGIVPDLAVLKRVQMPQSDDSPEGAAGMVFVDIPGGTFQMGEYDDVATDRQPAHLVKLDGFRMSKYETTNAQYAAYLNTAMAGGLIQVVNGFVFASSDSGRIRKYCMTHIVSDSQIEYSQGRFTVISREGKDMSDHPVLEVSWYGAKAFCDYYGYRLPTEAEWEYAARGGYHDPYYNYPWGSNDIDYSKANYCESSSYCNPLNLRDWPFTSPVGYFGPQGAYGLCDMSGNVREWCQDWYGGSYYYDLRYFGESPAINPTGPTTGEERVARGGSWDANIWECRVVYRNHYDPNLDYWYHRQFGFRVCCDE